MVKKMKIGKKTIMLGTLLLLCSFSFGMLAQAKPARAVLTFEFVWDKYGDPVRAWTTEGGIYHSIMTPHYGSVTDSYTGFIGTVYYCGNLVLFDPANWVGLGGGVFKFDGAYNGNVAGFIGKLHFKIENFQIIGKLTCHGTGIFEGKLIKGTSLGALGGATVVQISIWN